MANGTEIAIVGLSGRFPGAKSVGEFWDNLAAGRESIRLDDASSVRAEDEGRGHWVKVNGLMQAVDLFDAPFFGFNPREAEMMDPQHRIFLECAWEALEHAGYQVGDSKRSVGVFAGAALSGYIAGQLSDDAHLLETLPVIIANDKDYLATRISYKLNLCGPSLTVQCACSTSLVAVHLACQSLIAGECDAALAGGISMALPRIDNYYYLPGSLLSPDGRCRAFDARAKGTAFAEGAGIVLLMRLEDALRDGYSIYSVILGSAVNNDASLKAGYTAPSIEGQVDVIRQAQAVAGVRPSDISYIEAHGTGTVLGDAVELAALTRVFMSDTTAVGMCGLGSVKTNIGHLSTAAGVAGLIKTALALEKRIIPASLNFEVPNPDLDLKTSPFYITSEVTPWRTRCDAPRRAGVSSFGVGGTNSHIVLEEPPAVSQSPNARAWNVLPISAKNEAALSAATDQLRDYLMLSSDEMFASAVYTQQIGRRDFEHRRALICSDRKDAVAAPESSDRVFTRKLSSDPPVIAFMFPGQGAQYVGMGAGLYNTEKVFREHVDICTEHLKRDHDVDLAALLHGETAPSAEAQMQLQETALAQPALFVTEYALGQLIMSWGISPAFMIGHSIGEYVAACLSGVLSMEDALRLVAARGRLMQQMPPGAMLSVVLSPDELALLGTDLDIAAINAPNQCVVAGAINRITELERILTGKDVACRRLYTSHAFHSSMMDTMLEPFSREVAKASIGGPRLPYISSLTGRFVTEAELREIGYWSRQIREPVQFAQGIENLIASGATLLLEVGPGRGLSTLARQNKVETRNATVIDLMPDAKTGTSDAFWLMRALGKIWIAGASVNWSNLYPEEKPRRIALPTYPFTRQRYWIEPQKRESSAPGSGMKSQVVNWLYTPTWKRLGPISPEAVPIRPGAETILIFCDPAGVGRSIGARWNSTSKRIIFAEPGQSFQKRTENDYVVDPKNVNDYQELVSDVLADGTKLDRVVHLWSLMPQEGKSEIDIFRKGQDCGLFSVLYLLRSLVAAGCAEQLAIDIVSAGLFDVLGTETLLPCNATLLALGKVAPQEHQNITCRVFDLEAARLTDATPSDLSDLSYHLSNTTDDLIVALRHGGRWVPRYDRILTDRLPDTSPRLREGGVYLITGGLGKIGLTLARHLAKACRAHLVLTGRSSLPEKTQWRAYLADEASESATRERVKALLDIEKDGGEVFVIRADVSQEEDVRAVRDIILQKYGRLNGVIHGAGNTTLLKSALETKPEDCEVHFAAKTYGLMALERVLDGVPLDCFLVLSSLSTVLGGLGHLAYSAANHAADALVHRHNRFSRVPWTTVDWDAWQFDDAKDAQLPASMVKLAMQPNEGAMAFDFVLRMPVESHVVISTAQLERRVRDWIKLRSLREQEVNGEQPRQSHARPEVGTRFEEPEGDLERRLANIWQNALGIDRVGRNDDFFEIGGHSLLAIQVLSNIRQTFGIEFPIDRAFEATTLRKAADVIDELLHERLTTLTEEEAELLLNQTVPTADARERLHVA
jgi:acyl transferase domain-containing protein